MAPVPGSGAFSDLLNELGLKASMSINGKAAQLIYPEAVSRNGRCRP